MERMPADSLESHPRESVQSAKSAAHSRMLTLSSNFIRAIQRYVIVYIILTIRRANIEATLGLTREKDLMSFDDHNR
jgi:hypothetical protein